MTSFDLYSINKRICSAAAIAGLSGLVLVGCNNNAGTNNAGTNSADTTDTAATDSTTNSDATTSADAPKDKSTIVIGTTEGDFADMVRNQVQADLESQGYEVKLVTFTDYVRPNLALAEGDLDINVFQHKPYLDTFKKENNLDLVEVFQVPTAPLGIYSGKKLL